MPPSDAVHDVLELLDGSTATIRDARPEDEAALLWFYNGLGAEARHLRFFSAAVAIAPVAHWAAEADPGAVSLLAFEGTRLVAHAAAIPEGPEEAEVAFAVADDRHGVGLATQLLRRLARRMTAQGISVLRADVLPANHEMLDVLRHAAPARTERDGSCLHVRVDVEDVLSAAPYNPAADPASVPEEAAPTHA